MELITGLLIAILAVILCMYHFSAKKRQLRKIPGPKGYPIVGNALQLDPTRPHKTLHNWAKQYGDIMKINLFGEDVVVANSYEAVTEILLKKSNDFAGRPKTFRTSALFKDDDLNLSDISPKWSFMKKASMTGFKQVGDQVTQLEEIFQGYLDELIDVFAKSKGKTLNVEDEVYTFVSHVTYTLVYGRAVKDSEERKQIATVNSKTNDALSPTAKYASLDTLPFLRGFWCKNYQEFMQIIQELRDFYEKALSTTMEQFNGDVRCVLDSLIKEMREPTLDTFSPITFDNIGAVGVNLTVAGTLTTTNAIYYLISLMAVNQDLQEEAFEHIVKAIGERSPSLNDRYMIPYIESMILEVLRLMSNAPIAVPHKALNHTSLLGYDIPKGTQVWPNLWLVHHDEHFWRDPWEFKPRRFLDEDGNLVKADHPFRKHFYAFGAGRRVCAAENLAKHRLFLFAVSMLQKFRFLMPESEIINTDPREFEFSFVLRANDYNVRIELRQ